MKRIVFQENTPFFLDAKRNAKGKNNPFTLIELLVSATCQIGVLLLYCLKKIHKNCTSVRPSGRTSRLPQANFSHLHIFTQSAFTLIELLVSAACQVRVLPLYFLKKINQVIISLRPQGRASYAGGVLHIFRRKMLHAPKVRFIQSAFTLIELLVSATC